MLGVSSTLPNTRLLEIRLTWTIASAALCPAPFVQTHTKSSRRQARRSAARDSAFDSPVISVIDPLKCAENPVSHREDEIRGHLNAGQPRAAWTLCQGLLRAGCVPRQPRLCGELVRTLCNKVSLREGWRAYTELKQCGWSPSYSVLHSLILAASKVGDVHKGLQALSDIKDLGMTPNVVTYCALISGLGSSEISRGQRANEIAHELWQELESSGQRLDAAAYRVGMKACIDIGKRKDSVTILNRIKKTGEMPDVRAYNILLKGASRSRNPTNAVDQVLQLMAEDGIAPSSATYATIIDGYVRIGNTSAAKRTFEKAKSSGVKFDIYAYGALIKGIVQQNDMPAALGIVKEMQREGIEPNDAIVNCVATGYAQSGRLKEAEEFLRRDSYVKRSARGFNAVLKSKLSFQSPQQVRDAALLLQENLELLHLETSADTFNTVMSGALGVGDPKLAIAVYQKMQKLDVKPDGITYTALIQAYAQLGELENAVKTFEALSSDKTAKLDSTAYCVLIDAFSKVGDMPGAERMLNSALQFAAKSGTKLPIGAHGSVLTGYVRLTQAREAFQFVRRYHAAGNTPDKRMLGELADVCVRSGEYKLAMQSVRALELLGVDVDRTKYRELMLARIRAAEDRENERSSEEGRVPEMSVRKMSRKARERRKERKNRSVALERFKFWLGLPNSYYDAEDTEYSDDDDDGYDDE